MRMKILTCAVSTLLGGPIFASEQLDHPDLENESFENEGVLSSTSSTSGLQAAQPSSQSQEQLEGNYSDIGRESVPLGMIQKVWSSANQNAGVYLVQHRENTIIRVVCRENTKSVLVLPKFDVVKKVIVGNPAILKTEQVSRNILMLTPQNFVGVDTNVTVIGESGLLYSFYVQVHGFNSKTLPDLKVIVSALDQQKKNKENPDSNQPFNLKAKNNSDYLRRVPFSNENLDYSYSMAGDRNIAPKRVFSDGWRTFFDYGEDMDKSEVPVIFRVVDGVDTEVNTFRKGNLLVAPDTGTFALKLGTKRVCVFKTKEVS